jgi:hypothetical protein
MTRHRRLSWPRAPGLRLKLANHHINTSVWDVQGKHFAYLIMCTIPKLCPSRFFLVPLNILPITRGPRLDTGKSQGPSMGCPGEQCAASICRRLIILVRCRSSSALHPTGIVQVPDFSIGVHASSHRVRKQLSTPRGPHAHNQRHAVIHSSGRHRRALPKHKQTHTIRINCISTCVKARSAALESYHRLAVGIPF